ncbi:MAG TPA: hypothetical protein VL337_14655 [Acidimicrobiales bacterium]|jgi:hypothetical protein|nr:hypothetical protein [Acidimicrobiales bacterium]
MLSNKATFFFYLAALICFVVAAAGEGWRFGRLGRRGLAPRVVLIPLGLALWLFPLMWNTGKLAF